MRLVFTIRYIEYSRLLSILLVPLEAVVLVVVRLPFSVPVTVKWIG